MAAEKKTIYFFDTCESEVKSAYVKVAVEVEVTGIAPIHSCVYPPTESTSGGNC